MWNGVRVGVERCGMIDGGWCACHSVRGREVEIILSSGAFGGGVV